MTLMECIRKPSYLRSKEEAQMIFLDFKKNPVLRQKFSRLVNYANFVSSEGKRGGRRSNIGINDDEEGKERV